MTTLSEQWRSIPGYEGYYEASTLGRIRSVRRTFLKSNGVVQTKQGQIISQRLTPLRNYPITCLSKLGVVKTHFVHQLIALAFLGPRPDGYHINHKDLDKLNPVPDNLEYVTPSENRKHAYREGAQSKAGAKNSKAKLNDEAIIRIRQLYSDGSFSQQELAEMYGVWQTTINRIINRKRWPHI